MRFGALFVLLVATTGCSGGPGPRVTTAGSGFNPNDPNPNPNSPSTISISPASDTLRIGGQRQFSAFDRTVNQYDVTWSLEEGAADPRQRRCGICDHNILDTGYYEEEALLNMLSDDPNTCLKVNINHPGIQLIYERHQ